MKKILVYLAVLGLLAALGGGTAYGESKELRQMLARPRHLTLADNRAAVVMAVGDLLAVKLGEGAPDWEVQVSGEGALTRIIALTVEKGVQGVWEATAPGTAVITAVGYYPCQRQQPACKIASPVFEATVVVQPRRDPEGEFRIGQSEFRFYDMILPMKGAAFLENSRTYVPAADLAVALGAEYHEQDGRAVLKAAGEAVVLHAGSWQISVGPLTVNMDVAPTIRDGVLYVPMRWAAEALGYRVGWDSSVRMATFSGE